MRKHCQLAVWLALLNLGWTACGVPPSEEAQVTVAATAPVLPTIAVDLSRTATPEPTHGRASTPLPSASPQPTVSSSAEPTAGVVALLGPGIPVMITSVNMLDTNRGWALGGPKGEEGLHVLRTEDGGHSWQDVTPPEVLPPPDPEYPWPWFEATAFFLDTEHAWAAFHLADGGMPGSVWRTVDGGRTWDRGWGMVGNVAAHNSTYSVLHFVDPQHGWLFTDSFYGAGSGETQLFRTTDGGFTWDLQLSFREVEGESWFSRELREMDFSDPLYGWIIVANPVVETFGVHWTEDGGQTWRRQDLGEIPGAPPAITDEFCYMGRETLLTAEVGLLTVFCQSPFLASTYDRGETWAFRPLPVAWAVSVDIVNPNLIFVLGQTASSEVTPSGGEEPMLYRSTDGGGSWVSIASVPWKGSLDFVNERVGWAIVEDEERAFLMHTRDGGRTWERFEPTTVEGPSSDRLGQLPPAIKPPSGTVLLGTDNLGQVRSLLTLPLDRPSAMAIAPSGEAITVALGDHRLRQWYLEETVNYPDVLGGHAEWIYDVVYSPDGWDVATASKDGKIKIWSQAALRSTVAVPAFTTARLGGHNGEVTAVAFSPDGMLLASASQDRTVKLWSTYWPLEEVGSLRGHTGWIWDVVFSPDGSLLATGSDDRTVRLWDPAAGTERSILSGHRSAVVGLAFSPDGQTIASASWDGTVRLWDPSAGKELRELRGHTDWVLQVAFSPDGKLLASASADGTVRIWDPETGNLLTTITGHNAPVRGVAFSPDGRLLVTIGDDGSLRFWGVAP